ncbi:MAG: tetratricopeptide repeat protein [Bacteroidetes bacterium]|nr:MAG: tetratricopeptide repeat protein [Bacteroidota bacterium]
MSTLLLALKAGFLQRIVPVLFLIAVIFPVSEAIAQPRDLSSDEAFSKALDQFSSNLFALSAANFSEFRRDFPQHGRLPESLYYESEARLAVGEVDEAIRLLEEFDSRFPLHPFPYKAQLTLGRHFVDSESYEEAIVRLARVLDSDPTDSQAAISVYWMGESSRQLGRDADALRYFLQVADDYPDTDTAPRALYARGFHQVRLKQYEEAASTFERLAASYPSSPLAANIDLALAEVYYETSDYIRAISEIERRLPNVTGTIEERALFLMAESYNHLRDSQNAILYYRRFTEGDTTSPYYRRALYGLAWNYYREGSFEWSAEQFRLVHQSGVDEIAAESMYYEAVNLKLAQQLEPALDQFLAAANAYPESDLADNALQEMGILQYELRMWREAYDSFGLMTKDYPGSELYPETILHRANTAIALGYFDSAFALFDEAIDLEAAPESLREEVTFQKSWLLYRNRDYVASEKEFSQMYAADPRSKNAAEALFWSAESAFQLDQYAVAEFRFNQYLREFPTGQNKDAAYYALGWTHFKRQDYASAIPEFERFLRAYTDEMGAVPYQSDARLRLADSYFATKRYADAVRVYGRLADDGDDYALYQIGQAYSNAGDNFEAISTFRQLLMDWGTSEWREETQYSLGYLYFLGQDYEQAIKEYEILITDYPRDPLAAKAQYGIGDSHFNAGRLEEAVAAYEVVLERYPASPFTADAAAGIQFALLATGDESRADSIIEEFIARNPGSPMIDQLRFRQAETRYQTGMVDEALVGFQQFVRTANSETFLPDAYFYMGSIFAERESPSEAKSYMRQVVDNYPDSPRYDQAARVLGHLLLEEGNYAAAEAVFTDLENHAGSDGGTVAEARYGRSVAMTGLGRQGEAEQLLLETARLAPDADETTPVYMGLARIELERGNNAEARRLFNLVVSRSLDETGADALYRLGMLDLENGNPGAAIETFGRMNDLYPGYPNWTARAYLRQAEALEQTGDVGEAVRLYELVIVDYPETDHSQAAQDAKTRLGQ